MIRKFARLAVAALLPFAAYAQEYPTKPVRLIVPFAPGGVMDLTARSIASPLGEALGQAVVVENRPGGGGNIGTDVVAQAAPDGYTLAAFTPTFVIAPAVRSTMPYDTVKDFVGVSLFVEAPTAIVAHPAFPANTLEDVAP